MRFISIAFTGLLIAATTAVAAPLGATTNVVARDAIGFTPPTERRGGVYYKPWKAPKPEKPDYDKPHHDKEPDKVRLRDRS